MVRRPIAVTNITFVELEIDYISQRDDWRAGSEVVVTELKKSITLPSAAAIITRHQLATYLSIIIFIGINLKCFLIIAALYIQIFMTVKETASKAGRTQDEIKK